MHRVTILTNNPVPLLPPQLYLPFLHIAQISDLVLNTIKDDPLNGKQVLSDLVQAFQSLVVYVLVGLPDEGNDKFVMKAADLVLAAPDSTRFRLFLLPSTPLNEADEEVFLKWVGSFYSPSEYFLPPTDDLFSSLPPPSLPNGLESPHEFSSQLLQFIQTQCLSIPFCQAIEYHEVTCKDCLVRDMMKVRKKKSPKQRNLRRLRQKRRRDAKRGHLEPLE